MPATTQSKQPTPFQRKIWDALSAVPSGRLTTYSRMAEATGHGTRAAQAAHNAVKAGVRDYGRKLPWHRVVRADGRLYLSGSRPADRSRIDRLRQEGIEVSDGGKITNIRDYLYDYRQ